MKDNNSTSNNPNEQKINMLSHWQIKLCESLDQAKGKELKQVLRFARWYLEGRLLELAKNENFEINPVTYDNLYTAMYATHESEINECELALEGKDHVWDPSGKLLTTEQLKDRIKSQKSLKEQCAMLLCGQCQKEPSDNN